MTIDSANAQPQVAAPPHRLGGYTHRHIVRAWIAAALIIAACGTALYGMAALIVVGTCIGAAVGIDLLLAVLSRSRLRSRWQRPALTGLLLALTFPATTPWPVALFGAMIAVLVGHGVFRGTLQPALVGRVVSQFVFAGYLSLNGALLYSPVLTPAHLFVGDIQNAERIPHYHGWLETQTAADAFEIQRPVQTLRKFADDKIPPDGELLFTPLLRDHLPPWRDTIFGAVPGGIGETCTIMLVIVGLYLIHRGFLRWQLPVALIVGAAVAVSILPVQVGGDYRWFPALEVEQGRAVGLAYVFYHLSAGQLMLTAFLLAGDVVASPMRVHGQIIYAAGIGVISVFMRLYGLLDGECYWSVLIMNLFVGTIDRNIRRPVLGLSEA